MFSSHWIILVSFSAARTGGSYGGGGYGAQGGAGYGAAPGGYGQAGYGGGAGAYGAQQGGWGDAAAAGGGWGQQVKYSACRCIATFKNCLVYALLIGCI